MLRKFFVEINVGTCPHWSSM